METKPEQSSEQEAQDDLAAVDENSAASESAQEPTAPLHVVTALRTRAQEAELGQARLQGKLDAITASQTKEVPAAISPLDAEIARQAAEGIAEEDMNISPAIYKADKLHDQQIANQAAVTAAANDHTTTQRTSAAAFALEHADYADVIHQGENLLTKYQKAEVLDAGVSFGKVSYDLCKKAIELANPKAAPKTSEQIEEEKVAAAAAVKKKADADAANKTVLSQDEILKNASPAAAAAFNL